MLKEILNTVFKNQAISSTHCYRDIVPAIILSTFSIFPSTLSTRPTSVQTWRFRMLFFRMAVNMLQTSAWQVMSHFSSNSTMQMTLSPSWIMKFISRSNWPPTSFQGKTNKSMFKALLYTYYHYQLFLNFKVAMTTHPFTAFPTLQQQNIQFF